MLSIMEVDLATRVQILNKAVCISHIINTFWQSYESNYSPLKKKKQKKQQLLIQERECFIPCGFFSFVLK